MFYCLLGARHIPATCSSADPQRLKVCFAAQRASSGRGHESKSPPLFESAHFAQCPQGPRPSGRPKTRTHFRLSPLHCGGPKHSPAFEYIESILWPELAPLGAISDIFLYVLYLGHSHRRRRRWWSPGSRPQHCQKPGGRPPPVPLRGLQLFRAQMSCVPGARSFFMP